MATTTLQKNARSNPAGSLIIKFLSGKFDALRYLPKLARGVLQFGADGELAATDTPELNGITIRGRIRRTVGALTPAAITTAGAGTYTAANIATGVITRDPSGAGRTDTTDTAANLISGLSLTTNYDAVECLLVNTADAAETITLAGGTGVTLKGTITCERDTVIRLAFTRTGAAAVTVRQV